VETDAKKDSEIETAFAARWWREQGLIGALLFGAAAALGIHCVRTGWLDRGTVGLETLPARQLNDRMDINDAEAPELELLPGIGPVLAERIVEYRQQHGAFRSIEALDAVPGIGPITIERLRPHIRIVP
jgi:competence protein ComEA